MVRSYFPMGNILDGCLLDDCGESRRGAVLLHLRVSVIGKWGEELTLPVSGGLEFLGLHAIQRDLLRCALGEEVLCVSVCACGYAAVVGAGRGGGREEEGWKGDGR
jgi:hypothetical protein